LTYLDGQLLSQVIQNRKRIASDETGDMYLYIFDNMVFVDTNLVGPFKLSTYKHWLSIRNALEKTFLDKGLFQYYALVDSQEKFRWCEFLGFKSANVLLGDKIELMVRNGY
jgi:hypothetical protein